MTDDSQAVTSPLGEVDGEVGRDGVVGVLLRPDLVDPAPDRPEVVIVTDCWGSDWDERAAATRLVAGALALRARVRIMRLVPAGGGSPPPVYYDSLFPVSSVQADSLSSGTRAVEEVSVTPAGAVVLAGSHSLGLAPRLAERSERPRLVALPMLGAGEPASPLSTHLTAGAVDVVGAFSELEGALLSDAAASGGGTKAPVCLLSVALPVNRAAFGAGVVGVSEFGPYVLVISGVGDGTASDASLPHDYLRHVFGDVAIAEVRPGAWTVTAPGRSMEMPWAMSRINLWRLMAHAITTVDLRPAGPIGREAIESLRLGTPIVVPEASAAAGHVAASNGGFVYRTHGEMVDAVAHLVADGELAGRLGASGRAWADRVHGDTEAFVSEVVSMVLGDGAAASD